MADANYEYAAEVSHLTKVIKKRKILDDVSFKLKKGHILGLLGPNGAGKTTTLRIMVQLMHATQGSVHIERYDVNQDFIHAIAQVGTLIESPDFYTYLSGFKNLRMLADVSRKQISDQQINEALDRVGLTKAKSEKVKTYSLGMRQRLGVAQAIIHQPSVLLLDEPMNGLDPAGAREFRELLRSFRDEGYSVVISSHLLSDIQLLADDIVMMQHGKVTFDGTLQQLLSRAKHQIIVTVEDGEAAVQALTAASIPFAQEDKKFKIDVQSNAENERLNVARILNNAGVLVTDLHVEGDNLEESFLTLMESEDKK